MQLISVIVPVYNVQEYLPQCLDSLCHQTYPDMEIILIDDGSTDDSSLICDTYAAEHENIIVIHQKNRGANSARQKGMDVCSGDFVGFVDGDDYVDIDTFETLYEAIQKSNSEMAVCRPYPVANDAVETGNTIHERICYHENEIEQFVEAAFRSTYSGEIEIAFWGKLYKKEILTGIRFYPLKRAQDVPFFIDVCSKLKKIIYCDIYKYHYRIRSNSITHANDSTLYDSQVEAYELALMKVKRYWPRGYPSFCVNSQSGCKTEQNISRN